MGSSAIRPRVRSHVEGVSRSSSSRIFSARAMSLPTDFSFSPPLYAGHEGRASSEVEDEPNELATSTDLDCDEDRDRTCPTVDAMVVAPAPQEARDERELASPPPPHGASNPGDPPTPARADDAEGPRGVQAFSLFLGFRGHAGGLFLLGDSPTLLLCGYSFEPDRKRTPRR